MRVLIAEDEQVNRVQLTRTLTAWGHDVLAVADGEAAWDALRTERIRFLISDWMMPGLDGLELCRRIREAEFPHYTYVILLTGNTDKGALVQGLESGADDFVLKPFNSAELKVRIRAGERVLRLEQDLAERNLKLQGAYEAAHRDLQAASELQKSLLPSSAISIPGLRFASLFQPSGFVAGDIFNIFPLDETRSGFYLLDVAGHGVSSAMLSFTLSKMLTPSSAPDSIVRRAVVHGTGAFEVADPARVVGELNMRFEEAGDAMRYFTMVYGVVEPSANRIRLVQAGHPPPLAQHAGTISEVGESGYPVGMLPGLEFEESIVPFETGDRLVLYSDGITECPGGEGEPFGGSRLEAALAAGRDEPLHAAVGRIEDTLSRWNGGKEFGDDVSLLAIERL